jgi:hypothetical protein
MSRAVTSWVKDRSTSRGNPKPSACCGETKRCSALRSNRVASMRSPLDSPYPPGGRRSCRPRAPPPQRGRDRRRPVRRTVRRRSPACRNRSCARGARGVNAPRKSRESPSRRLRNFEASLGRPLTSAERIGVTKTAVLKPARPRSRRPDRLNDRAGHAARQDGTITGPEIRIGTTAWQAGDLLRTGTTGGTPQRRPGLTAAQVSAGVELGGLLVEPAPGIHLASEVPGVLLAFVVAVPGAKPPVTDRPRCRQAHELTATIATPLRRRHDRTVGPPRSAQPQR